VDYDENWLNMLADRNLVVHLYEEEMADEIYDSLPDYLTLFEKLYSKLKKY